MEGRGSCRDLMQGFGGQMAEVTQLGSPRVLIAYVKYTESLIPQNCSELEVVGQELEILIR
jgi:hypothetical protein